MLRKRERKISKTTNGSTTAGEVNKIEQMYSPIRRKQENSIYQFDENKETIFTDTVYLLTVYLQFVEEDN